MRALVSAERLSRHYLRGAQVVRALDSISFDVVEGDFLAILGPSGSGKSTLLNLIGCMDSPTSGTLLIDGQDATRAGERLKVRFRRKYIGFVFQHFGLIPTLSVAENVLLPNLFFHSSQHYEVDSLLEKLNLSSRRNHRPAELSGGEMQRVAIARALFNKPKLLLADEPTGNLDSATAESVLNLFRQLNEEGLTVIVVTHNHQLAQVAKRQIILTDGRISLDSGLLVLPGGN